MKQISYASNIRSREEPFRSSQTQGCFFQRQLGHHLQYSCASHNSSRQVLLIFLEKGLLTSELKWAIILLVMECSLPSRLAIQTFWYVVNFRGSIPGSCYIYKMNCQYSNEHSREKIRKNAILWCFELVAKTVNGPTLSGKYCWQRYMKS